MKNKIIAAVLITIMGFTACNSSEPKESKTEQTAVTSAGQFVCSMHPESVGKKGDKCSKCSMKLTVLVVEKVKDTTQKINSYKK
jgi:Heavy metal binding domain